MPNIVNIVSVKITTAKRQLNFRPAWTHDIFECYAPFYFSIGPCVNRLNLAFSLIQLIAPSLPWPAIRKSLNHT